MPTRIHSVNALVWGDYKIVDIKEGRLFECVLIAVFLSSNGSHKLPRVKALKHCDNDVTFMTKTRETIVVFNTFCSRFEWAAHALHTKL